MERVLFSQASFFGSFALLSFLRGLTEAALAGPPTSRLCRSYRTTAANAAETVGHNDQLLQVSLWLTPSLFQLAILSFSLRDC